MMREGRQKIWNVPNALTMLRMLLIPVYWVLIMRRGNELAALIVFVVASLTDLLDGYIARKYNQITDFGKLFDPLADKLMVLSVLLSQVLLGVVPLLVLIVILAKEGIMVWGGIVMLRHQVVVYSKPIGKIAQAVMVLGLILSFFHEHYPPGFPLHLIVLGIGVALTLGALIYYTRACIAALNNKGSVPEQQEEFDAKR